MSARPMTPDEWKAAVANAEKLARIAEQKNDEYGQKLRAHLAALSELRKSTEWLEVWHGADWWKHADTPTRRELRERIEKTRKEADTAERAAVRAKKKHERAASFQVIRTFTDATGWKANAKFAQIEEASK
jgi:hypothetical protein